MWSKFKLKSKTPTVKLHPKMAVSAMASAFPQTIPLSNIPIVPPTRHFNTVTDNVPALYTQGSATAPSKAISIAKKLLHFVENTTSADQVIVHDMAIQIYSDNIPVTILTTSMTGTLMQTSKVAKHPDAQKRKAHKYQKSFHV